MNLIETLKSRDFASTNTNYLLKRESIKISGIPYPVTPPIRRCRKQKKKKKDFCHTPLKTSARNDRYLHDLCKNVKNEGESKGKRRTFYPDI